MYRQDISLGEAQARRALVFALLGLFVSCLYSVAAITQGRRAERNGVPAQGAIITGWVGLVLGLIVTVYFIGSILALAR